MEFEIRGDYMKKNNLIWIIICNILGALLLGSWLALYFLNGVAERRMKLENK